MKKITLLFLTLLISSIGFSQNLVVNGDFQTGAVGDPVESWGGYKNRIAIDDITTSNVGQIENGDGSLFHLIDVTPGDTYDVSFKYRWLSSGGASDAVLIARVKDDLASGKPNLTFTDNSDGFTFSTNLDEWLTADFSVTIPSGVTKIRLLFFKPNGNKPVNLDDVTFTKSSTASLESLQQFNFSAYPNPVDNNLTISASEEVEKIEIFNLLGQKVINISPNSGNTQIDVTTLANGIYMLRATVNSKKGTYKFIKQ
jgi:hypothetical protein